MLKSVPISKHKTMSRFYIGQEIVAIRDHSRGVFKNGDEFVIEGIEQGCCGINLNIGIPADRPMWYCSGCNVTGLNIDGVYWFDSRCFAPKHTFGEEVSDRLEKEINQEIKKSIPHREGVEL